MPIDPCRYVADNLYVEGVALAEVVAAVGTPSYVYSRQAIEQHWRAFDEAFGDYPHQICYAVKANGTLAILDLLARLGSGFDIVSGGELERVLRAGGDPAKIIFSGVGKSEAEVRRALEVGIGCLNLESDAELDRVNRIAGEVGVKAPIAVRINPDIDARTHPYIATGMRDNKFGIAMEVALNTYSKAFDMAHVNVSGVACHIGSQLIELSPFVEALHRTIDFVEKLEIAGVKLTKLDLGGGLGIRYGEEEPPVPKAYIGALLSTLEQRACQLPVTIEPGRTIVGNAGVLLSRVEYIKESPWRNFVIVDAAMNDLIRPALYQAWHDVVPLTRLGQSDAKIYDVVGPVCESADFLAKDRRLVLSEGDHIVIGSAGAYGFVLSSNYNARPRPAEVMVDGEDYHVVRSRETFEQMLNGEQTVPV
ncbi:MAG: diaminopimelate decarboxylase [Pseudomonadota bacterium]|jgi:diaminopimelate decarboxylase|nr:diaminopimelate decarboxylase [Pseudomonadota bacterium]